VLSWDDVGRPELRSLIPRKADTVIRYAEESTKRLESGDARYFGERLPSNQQWRLFPDFRHSVAYVDIETTGLGAPADYITAIALYDGDSLRHYVHGQNLEQFREDIGAYKLVVTYNGKQFDLPFIRRYLGAPMLQAHVDLRYVLHSLGYKGGLKGCERQLGIDRGELDGIDGFFAVLLWRDYQRNGNEKALETLLAYNAADVVNLETLLVLAYNMKLRGTAFEQSHCLTVPTPLHIPLRADPATVEKLRCEHVWV